MSALWRNHVVFTESDHVKTICSPLKDLSIDGCFFMRIFPDGSFIDLATNLSWSEHFLENYFSEKYNFKTTKKTIILEQNIDLWSANEGNDFFIDAHRNFNIKEGIFIRLNQLKWQDIFCYYIDQYSKLSAIDLINLIDILRKFSEYFLKTAKDIIELGAKNTLLTPQKYLSLFKKPEKIIIPYLKELFKIIPDGAEINLSGFQSLSSRELDCIYHAEKGLNSDAIGKKMFLSRRTVESYIISARNKTNCKNLTELVYHYNFIKNYL